MCNLYSMSKGQAAIREMVSVWRDDTGNLPALTGIYPNYFAPVVTQAKEGRVLEMMRWGMPSPGKALVGKSYDKGLTNVRNTKSGHWRNWLKPEHRCVVPFTSFAEPGPDHKPVWFAFDDSRPLAFFAGIHVRSWTSVRKVKERRNDGRSVRVSDNRAKRRGGRDPPKGDAGHPQKSPRS